MSGGWPSRQALSSVAVWRALVESGAYLMLDASPSKKRAPKGLAERLDFRAVLVVVGLVGPSSTGLRMSGSRRVGTWLEEFTLMEWMRPERRFLVGLESRFWAPFGSPP